MTERGASPALRTDLAALIALALPSAVTLLLNNAYRFNDLYFVGLLPGQAAVTAQAAVAVAGLVTILCYAFYEGLATGVMAASARAHGAADPQRARRIFEVGLVSAICICATIAVVGTVFLDPLCALLLGVDGADTSSAKRDEMRELAAYLGPCLQASIFLCLAPLTGHAFLAMRDSRTPLLLEILAVAVNTALNAVLVPTYGCAGAGWATVLSRVVSSSIGLLLLHRRLPRSDGSDRRSAARIGLDIARVGLPAVVAIGFYSIAYQAVLATSFPPFGAVGRAAFGIGFTIEGLAFCFVWGVANAGGSLAANALGHGLVAEAKAVVRRAIGVGLLFVVPQTLLFMLGADALAALLSTDGATRCEVARYLRIIAWSQWAVAVQGIQEVVLYATGYATAPCLSTLFWNASRIPLCYVLAAQHGLAGIWWAINLTSYGKALTATWLFRRGTWQRTGLDAQYTAAGRSTNAAGRTDTGSESRT